MASKVWQPRLPLHSRGEADQRRQGQGVGHAEDVKKDKGS